MVMEYVQGLTLEDYIFKIQQDGQYMSQHDILNIIKQLCEAINYIHSHGVCHRDLKPDNVLINPKTKQVKLTDFNISKKFMAIEEGKTISFSMRTRTGLDMWSAPETRQGGSYDKRIDFWGLGVLSYFLTMQRPPFYDADEIKLIESVISCNYP